MSDERNDDWSIQREGVGRRVQVARKLRGMTQPQLAQAAHVSASLVAQVEQGSKPASAAFVTAVALPLRMSVQALYGQQHSVESSAENELEHLAALETVVMVGGGTALTDRPGSLQQLRQRVDEVADLQRDGKYGSSSGLLLSLVPELHAAAEVHGVSAQQLLGRTYLLTCLCLHRLGSAVSAQAGERAIDAAGRGSDPLLSAVAEVELGMRLLHRGAVTAAGERVNGARDLIAEEPANEDVLSVRGHAHLSSAIIAARNGNGGICSSHLDEARACANHVQDGQDRYDTGFGPSNLTMFAVASAVEMSDGASAVRQNGRIGESIMPSRRAHHHVDVARAHLLDGNRDATLLNLNMARKAAPQLCRNHPSVPETLRVLAERERRRSDSLAEFAQWAHVAL